MNKATQLFKNIFTKDIIKLILFSYVLRGWFFLFVFFSAIEFICTYKRDPIYELNLYIYAKGILLSLIFFLSIYQIKRILKRREEIIFSIIVTFLLSFLLVASVAVFFEFGDFLSLSKILFFVNNPNYQKAYIREYLLNWDIIIFFVLWAVVYFIFNIKPVKYRETSKKNNLIVLLVGLVIYLFVLTNVTLKSVNKRLDITTSFISSINKMRLIPPSGLHQPNRRAVEYFTPREKFNIIFLLNESFGKKAFDLADKNCPMPILKSWVEENGDQCVYFDNAFTNSSATDVSVTSIQTGVAPYESETKLHSTPLIWDWEKKAGMTTAVVSAQFYQWANFPLFFTPRPDYFFTGENISGKTANDGIDELAAMNKFCEIISELSTKQPFGAMYNSNSLHFPFQQESQLMPNKPNYDSKYRNAAAVLDYGYEKLFNLLKSKKLLENTVIIITADHGETDTPNHISTHRLYSFYDEIQNIPMLIYIPKALSDKFPELMANLRINKQRTVANLDIYPTIIDLLGGNSTPQNIKLYNSLKGYSLFKPIPEDRYTISLNTNDIRKWELEGFGIFLKDRRFVYTDLEKQKYFDITNDKDQNNNIWDNTNPSEKDRIENIIYTHGYLFKIYKK
jgi:phosphoglycerol transferase MdoB-like AlkP superfamily enzyme